MSTITVTQTEEVDTMPVAKKTKIAVTEVTEQEIDSRIYEYTSAANPYMV